MPRFCSDCGEPIDPKRLEAVPEALNCFHCANAAQGANAVAPPKRIETKSLGITLHLKRYLRNVGRKEDPKALFRTLVRLSYLFPDVSATELTSILLAWSKQTSSPFDQTQLKQLVLEARNWVQNHPKTRG